MFKMKFSLSSSLTLSFFIALQAGATLVDVPKIPEKEPIPVECPDFIKNLSNQIPECPSGNLVPETFPVAVVTVAEQKFRGQSFDTSTSTVEKILMGAGENTPIVLAHVSDKIFAEMLDMIDGLNINSELKKKYKSRLAQIPGKSYEWQKDAWHPIINKTTGKINIRAVDNYSYPMGRENSRNLVGKILQLTQACGMVQDFRNPISNLSDSTGGFAGNIGVLPGGICMLGDQGMAIRQNGHLTADPWEIYADHICDEGEANRIRVPTGWLHVGHTDEVVKVIRNNKAPDPCNFSVVVASPAKALELLKASPNEKFLDLVDGDIPFSKYDGFPGFNIFCKDPSEKNIPDENVKKEKGVTKLFDFFLQNAFANFSPRHNLLGDVNKCRNLTNKEAYATIQSNNQIKFYNELVQERMNGLKEDITKKLKAKLPQCKADFIDAPDIFFGGQLVEEDHNKLALPNRMGLSLLPNPSNSVSINDTLISPEPVNPAFKRFLDAEYVKRGLKTQYIYTFEGLHAKGGGNLHCATNTIHLCRPKSSKDTP